MLTSKYYLTKYTSIRYEDLPKIQPKQTKAQGLKSQCTCRWLMITEISRIKYISKISTILEIIVPIIRSVYHIGYLTIC